MIKCKYEIPGKANIKWDSLEELLTYLEANLPGEFDTISDVVFSSDRADRIKDSLVELKRQSKLTAKRRSEVDNITEFSAIIDNSPVYEGSGNRKIISLQQLVDLDIYARPDGTRWMAPMDTEKYKEELFIKKVEDGLSEEQARAEVQNITDHWKQIEDDGIVIHTLSTAKEIWDINGKSSSFKQKARAELNMDEDTIQDMYHQFKDAYINLKRQFPDSAAISNINLQEEIEEYDFDLVGHIDHLIIGSDGVLHLYNFKVSETKPSQWSQHKEEKYKHELALLKQMLNKKGYNIKNITLSIIPIELQYNPEDNTKIDKVLVHWQPNVVRTYNLNSSGKYGFVHYDRAATSMIKVGIHEPTISDEITSRADAICETLLPELGVKSTAVSQSALDWIKSASRTSYPIAIVETNEAGHAFDVIINNKKYPIKSSKPKTKNEEIIKLVTEHIKEIDDHKSDISQAVSDAINKGYADAKNNGFRYGLKSYFDGIRGFRGSTADDLQAILAKYFDCEGNQDGSYKPKWTRVAPENDKLINAGIFLFQNNTTGQLDVVTISPWNLNSQMLFKSHATNILGAYKMDTEIDTMRGDYGNIETVRSLILLNELLPQLEGTNFKLGDIKVVSPVNGGLARSYSIENVVKNYFPQIFRTIREKNPSLAIKSNFKQSEYIDPIVSVIQSYNVLMDSQSAPVKEAYELAGFKALREANNEEQKLLALEDILAYLTNGNNKGNSRSYSFKGIKSIADRAALEYDPKSKLIAELANAYLYYSGQNIDYRTSWSTFTNLYTSTRVPDHNVRLVVSNYIKTVDSIASETEQFYDEFIRSSILEFYKAKNYSTVENTTIGDQLRVYKNLYERDSQGKNMFIFKNPYERLNDDTYLTKDERKFLKHALYLFAVNRYDNFNIAEDDDDGIIEFMKKTGVTTPGYLWVPLRHASKASSRQKGARLKEFTGKVVDAIKNHSLEHLEEYAERGISDSQTRNDIDESFDELKVRNPYWIGDSNQTRDNYLEAHPEEYFETNVETLLIDYSFHSISEEKLNRMLVGTKAILLQMHLTGKDSNNSTIIDKEIEYITKYIQKNVFNKSAMDDTQRKIVGALSPVRSVVSYVNLAGNIVSAVRDTLNGVYENYMRAVTNYQTDISAASVSKAYGYVVTHGMNSALAVTLLSKLCVKYRLSNVDLARITEGLNSNRGGIFNWDNWAFATLRKPDFLNRMVLFVAKCMEDGVWDAYSMKGDTLVYDWTKDKRFNLLQKNPSELSEEDYKIYCKQAALYKQKVQDYNKTHPKANTEDMISLDFTDGTPGLPEPYSPQEIISIKETANNIYGAYDVGLRNMLENTAAGWMFAMYTTWMNGIWNNWMTEPGTYENAQRETVQEIDEEGNLLFTNVETGEITTDDNNGKNIPLMKSQPMFVHGIGFTLRDMFYKSISDEGFKSMIEYVKGNPQVQKNLLKGTSDLLVWMLFMLLFKSVLDPAYKDYKKDMKDNPVVQNLLVEILYKSSGRAYDSFGGPLNIIEYFGENMNPPIYKVPMKVITDAGKTIFGDKTFGQFMVGNFAVTRAYRDTYLASTK